MEAELKKLEDEIEAQKAAYEKMAIQMPIFTKSINFTTSANPMNIRYPDNTNYSFDGNERVIVTFTTSRGSNTLATLELTSDAIKAVVYDMPNYDGGGNRIDTHYNFTVQSAVDGTLGAKMIWQ